VVEQMLSFHKSRTFAFALLAALAVFFAAVAAHAALSFPALTGRVVDDAGILSGETKQKLEAFLAEHEQQTGHQVVVATLKDLGGTDIADYGYQLGRAWGIGQKGKNTGALIIVSPATHDVRIEVGYGLEGDLTDAQSKLIIENVMLPAFRKGDYDKGVLDGTVNVLRTLGGKPTGAESIAQPHERRGGSPLGGIPFFVIAIIIWVVFGRFLWPLLLIGGIGRGGGFGGGFGGGGWGSGGGGFSGGGGSFGGGGASGHW
jgi:uncharacterized protein